MKTKATLRMSVFIPAAVLVSVFMLLISLGGDVYVDVITRSYRSVMDKIGWTFGPATLVFVGIMFYSIFGKVGKIVIGGKGAERILDPVSFYGVVVTGLTATGLIFYGATEPVYHFMNPPAHLGVEAGTAEAIRASMGITFLHWTINVFSIYSVLALAVALGVYNLGYNFSVSSILRPVFGKWMDGALGSVLDVFILFSMVLGNIYSLGQLMISVSSGVNTLFDIPRSGLIYMLIAVVVIVASLICINGGIAKAVKKIANLNMYVFYFMVAFFVLLGPMSFSFGIAMDGLSYFFDNYLTLSLANGQACSDSWPSMWTIAYIGGWAGIGPIMALFLGKIARGYTVRQFVNCIFVGGSLFYFFWFVIFGGNGIATEMAHGDIFSTISENGFESGIYVFFEHYPLATLMSLTYIFVSLLSFVTTMVAKLDGLSSLCCQNVNAEQMSTPFWLKLMWGVVAGVLGWACATYLGFQGVRMFAGFSGLTGMIVTVLSSVSLIWMFMHVQEDENGEPILSRETMKQTLIERVSTARRIKREEVA